MIPQASGALKVEVGRFNEPVRTIEVPEGATVKDVVDKAGITLSESETLWVAGEKAELHYKVEDGDRIQIVGKKEGGLDPEEDDEEKTEEEQN